jgi:hypothetical protein
VGTLTIRQAWETQLLERRVGRSDRDRNQCTHDSEPRPADEYSHRGDHHRRLDGPANHCGCQQIVVCQPEHQVEAKLGNGDGSRDGQGDRGDNEPGDGGPERDEIQQSDKHPEQDGYGT